MLAIVVSNAVTLAFVASFSFVRHSCSIALTFGLLSVACGGHAKAASRDIYRYDLGGTIEISSQKDLETSRSFLWRHWIQHKRGIIVTVVHGVDTADSTISYFVEPNAPGGDWRIVIESRRNPNADADSTIQRIIIYDVKRVEPIKNGWDKPVEIATDAVRQPNSYMLSLKTQAGDVFVNL